MKDEMGGVIIDEAVFIRSKLYSIKYDSNLFKKVGKGVKKYALKNKITHDDYLRALFDDELIYCEQRSIRVKSHHVLSVNEKKLAIRSLDDKRYTLDDKISTLAHGDYRIALMEKNVD
ncbi:hypothetical protein QAD02_020730 [Eretmocerus hayati]|uniref:Uncharacterized protein n=3 Tax=Eretmocerus hayati TaxID=131215 RepID=A0ACC2PNE5_9HYME|nr:hypothetical protein QAD02_008354 [Eretmocerus hayati]KAJ8671063.1 hypothetical protein QAD02_002322 [Eretmocerus hayati]KAJ8684937.1 hypothetical protein QAD02_020730 [Eretmocerus hayati]